MTKLIRQPDITKPKKKRKTHPADYLGGLTGETIKAKKSRKKLLEAAHAASKPAPKKAKAKDTGGRRTAKTPEGIQKTVAQGEAEKKAIRKKIDRRVKKSKQRKIYEANNPKRAR